jgi:hypothetical protein
MFQCGEKKYLMAGTMETFLAIQIIHVIWLQRWSSMAAIFG